MNYKRAHPLGIVTRNFHKCTVLKIVFRMLGVGFIIWSCAMGRQTRAGIRVSLPGNKYFQPWTPLPRD